MEGISEKYLNTIYSDQALHINWIWNYTDLATIKICRIGCSYSRIDRCSGFWENPKWSTSDRIAEEDVLTVIDLVALFPVWTSMSALGVKIRASY